MGLLHKPGPAVLSTRSWHACVGQYSRGLDVADTN